MIHIGAMAEVRSVIEGVGRGVDTVVARDVVSNLQ